MRRPGRVICMAALPLALVLAGCGPNSGSKTIKENFVLPPSHKPPPVKVQFASSAVHGGKLPSLYTCDGRNISPPLNWGKLPAKVEQFALFAVGFERTSGGISKRIEWVMAGLHRSLHGLKAGEVPRGAILLTNTDGKQGYSICPAKGTSAQYEFALYALPPRVAIGPGLPGTTLLANLTVLIPEYRAPAFGTFKASYTRQ